MELLGIKSEIPFDGQSIAGVLHGTRKAEEVPPLYWEFYEKKITFFTYNLHLFFFSNQ